MTPPPEYIAHRIELFEKLKAEYDAEVAGRCCEPHRDFTCLYFHSKTEGGDHYYSPRWSYKDRKIMGDFTNEHCDGNFEESC